MLWNLSFVEQRCSYAFIAILMKYKNRNVFVHTDIWVVCKWCLSVNGVQWKYKKTKTKEQQLRKKGKQFVSSLLLLYPPNTGYTYLLLWCSLLRPIKNLRGPSGIGTTDQLEADPLITSKAFTRHDGRWRCSEMGAKLLLTWGTHQERGRSCCHVRKDEPCVRH